MAFNIVSSIISMLTPSVLDKLAAALGMNGGAARSALTAAVPAVLAAIGSKATSDTGARALFDAVSKTDTGALGDLAGTLSGSKGENFLQGGLGALGNLLGDNGLKGLTGAVAKQAGLGSDASSSIVALASQLAMGQMAKSVASDGLDASGLGAMLRSQQSNITAALPAGLGSLLASAGVAGSNIAGEAGRAASNAAAAAQQKAAAAKQGMNRLYWVLPLLIALALLWWFLGRSAPVVNTATAPVQELVVDGLDVSKQVASTFDGLKTTLGGITDAATAQAALPKLQDAVTAVDGMSGMLSKLSAEQKTMLAGLVGTALPTLKELVAKVMAVPGVGDVVKPTLDGLMTKLETLAKPA